MDRIAALPPHFKVCLAMLLGIGLFAIRIALFLGAYRSDLGAVYWVLPKMLVVTGVLWIALAIGIARKRKWASNWFMLFWLFMGLSLFTDPIRLFNLHWWLLLVLAAEGTLLVVALLQLVKVPKEEWQSGRRAWWLRPHLYGMALWMVLQLELWLMVAGLSPDSLFAPQYFSQVAELVVRQDYTADEFGITRMHADAVELASQGTWKGKDYGTYHNDFPYSPSVFSLYEDKIRVEREGSDLAFERMVDSLRAVPDSLLTAVDSAYLEYAEFPVNRAGFRSIPFRPYPNAKRKRVLLIGDSFTFGWSARPWTGSFADELSARGYVVYNTGITATDPAQYEAVARRYIPELLPDAVVVNVFLGNDIMEYPREVRPHQMAYYATNAGVMMACPRGIYLPNADSAYHFYLNEYFLSPGKGWLAELSTHTVLGATFRKGLDYLGLLSSMNMGPNPEYHRQTESLKDPTASRNYLVGIQEVCKTHGIPVTFAIIPDVSDVDPNPLQDFPGVFEGLPVQVPQVTRDDYNPVEEHFNLQGHRKYAAWLDSLLGGAQ